MGAKQDILVGIKEGHVASLSSSSFKPNKAATKQAFIKANIELTSGLVEEAFAGAHECILEAGIPPEERRLYAEWKDRNAGYDNDIARAISKVAKTGWLLGLEHSKDYSRKAFKPTAVFIEPDGHFTVLKTNIARNLEGRQPKYIWDVPDELAVAVDRRYWRKSRNDQEVEAMWTELTDSERWLFGSKGLGININGLGLVLNSTRSSLDIYDSTGGSQHDRPDSTYRMPLHLSLGRAISRLAFRHGHGLQKN